MSIHETKINPFYVSEDKVQNRHDNVARDDEDDVQFGHLERKNTALDRIVEEKNDLSRESGDAGSSLSGEGLK